MLTVHRQYVYVAHQSWYESACIWREPALNVLDSFLLPLVACDSLLNDWPDLLFHVCMAADINLSVPPELLCDTLCNLLEASAAKQVLKETSP